MYAELKRSVKGEELRTLIQLIHMLMWELYMILIESLNCYFNYPIFHQLSSTLCRFTENQFQNMIQYTLSTFIMMLDKLVKKYKLILVTQIYLWCCTQELHWLWKSILWLNTDSTKWRLCFVFFPHLNCSLMVLKRIVGTNLFAQFINYRSWYSNLWTK